MKIASQHNDEEMDWESTDSPLVNIVNNVEGDTEEDAENIEEKPKVRGQIRIYTEIKVYENFKVANEAFSYNQEYKFRYTRESQ